MKNSLFKSCPFSKLTVWFLLIIMLWTFISIEKWGKAETKQKLIAWDVTSYYCYLPAIFIHHDLTLNFTKRGTNKAYEENQQYWYQTAPNGSRVIKFTMGVAVMYAPFFLIAHAWANTFGYTANGFSTPYEFFIALSSLVYLFIGLLYLRKTLLLYFNEVITGTTLICIALGTNLYYYSSSEPAMSHAYSFAVVSIFVFNVIKWHSSPTLLRSVLIGFLFGLIVLIRPVNILIAVFPMLFAINSLKTAKAKISFLWTNRKYILIMAFTGFLVFLPQLIYWKYLTGEWFFYSYLEEHFYFNNPHVWLGLFSFRNGWLMYSPIIIFSLIGILYTRKVNCSFFLPLVVFSILNIFVCYSWWTWWYGGSFGSRPMIDSYALLAIPMATLFERVFYKSKVAFATLSLILAVLISLNLFQSFQRRIGIIHWDSMTAKAYQIVFLKTELSNQDIIELEKTLYHPDYDHAKAGLDE